VGRTIISLTSTSAGCSIANTMARAIASGGSANSSRAPSSCAFTSGFVTPSAKFVRTNPGKMIDVVIVDINNFAGMVRDAITGFSGGQLIAQFTRDALGGAIAAIESNEGEVVGIMGDAIFAVVPEGPHIFGACVTMAESVDRSCEYLSNHQREFPQDWDYAPGGFSAKICVEFGWMDISNITTRHLGRQNPLIGPAINYASRIGRAGAGNRCHLGPVAAHKPELSQYSPKGPYTVAGKEGEENYSYYELSFSDIGREDPRTPDDTYWG